MIEGIAVLVPSKRLTKHNPTSDMNICYCKTDWAIISCRTLFFIRFVLSKSSELMPIPKYKRFAKYIVDVKLECEFSIESAKGYFFFIFRGY